MDQINKALTEQQRLERLLRRQELIVRAAFAAFLAEARAPALIRQVREMIERGDIEAALQIADSHVLRLSSVMPRVFEAVADDEVRAIGLTLAGRLSRVAISFDVTNPRAVALMRTNRLKFVQEFTRQQRQATRAALVSALQSGQSTATAARAFRDSIGLTGHQYDTVQNYRNLLISNSRQALERALRDRRFDTTLTRAVEEKVPLTAAQIERMTERYHDRLLGLRSETIARTETQRVLNQARQESLQQTIDQAGFAPGSVRRVWHATRDKRTRDTHAAMDGQRRGLQEAFVSPSGARLMYPGDPNAPGSETINCRCVITTEFI